MAVARVKGCSGGACTDQAPYNRGTLAAWRCAFSAVLWLGEDGLDRIEDGLPAGYDSRDSTAMTPGAPACKQIETPTPNSAMSNALSVLS